ncbi:hypothetical protein GQ53DRAFT_845109 [Thozetella sp. PMI_491]|nr:hypothetical protein GQ53DRAFT_845109 [Thozetella sp. PMI_491]
MSPKPRTLPTVELGIPASSSFVDVRVIDTTTYGSASSSMVFDPDITGYTKFEFPSYAFLITNPVLNKHILFDLGMRKDWLEALPSGTVEWIHQYMPFTVKEDVNDILDADPGGLGIKTENIASVIWSHHHFDHRGNITKFPPSTEVVVGPGFQKAYAPYYPKLPQSSILEAEMTGRPVREIDESAFSTHLGRFQAHDFFGDGSFYLLNAPGHTTGHMCALARLPSPSAAAFAFLGGDCAHHPGVFRPAPGLPLPKEVGISTPSSVVVCPGALVQQYLHPRKSATEPFFSARAGVNENQQEAEKSVAAMQDFDASERVILCIAHDTALLKSIEFYPAKLSWKAGGTQQANWVKMKWLFLSDLVLPSLDKFTGDPE